MVAVFRTVTDNATGAPTRGDGQFAGQVGSNLPAHPIPSDDSP
jgi:hypothetical protein